MQVIIRDADRLEENVRKLKGSSDLHADKVTQHSTKNTVSGTQHTAHSIKDCKLSYRREFMREKTLN